MFLLRVQDYQGRLVQEVSLKDGAYSIGAGTENNVVLKDSGVNEQHAELIIQGDTCVIRRLENGGEVHLNGSAISEIALKPRDVISIGRYQLEVLWDEGKGSKVLDDYIGQLEVIYPKEMSGVMFLEKEKVMMGRVPECDIQVLDKQASRQHAKITLLNRIYVLEDLGSANGTWINGKKATTHPLTQGDVIQIGALQYRFTICHRNSTDALKRTAEISQVAVFAAAKAQNTQRHRSTLTIAGGVLLAVAMLGGLAFQIYSVRNQQKRTGPDNVDAVNYGVPVSITRLQNRNFVATFEDTGSIEAGKQMAIMPKTIANVKKILVTEGGKVEKGQTLMILEDKQLKKALDAANAEQDAAKQAMDEVIRLAPLVLQKMQLAEQRAKQLETLVKAGKASEKEELAARQQHLDAQKEAIEAKFGIQRMEQQLKAIALKVENIKEQIKELEITAPMSGLATQISVAEGDLPHGPLLQIINLDELLVMVRISQGDIAKIALGQQVRVTSSASPDVWFPGSVTEIGKTFNVTDRTAGIKIKLANTDSKLKPGNFVTVKFLLGTKNDVPAVPRQAVLSESGNRYIFIVRNLQQKQGRSFGTAAKLKIQLGFEDKRFVEIDALSLQQGDGNCLVVIEGQLNLSDGQAVEIVREIVQANDN